MDVIKDNSVDVVVVTLLLCSLNNVQATLKEILRVLTPVSECTRLKRGCDRICKLLSYGVYNFN